MVSTSVYNTNETITKTLLYDVRRERGRGLGGGLGSIKRKKNVRRGKREERGVVDRGVDKEGGNYRDGGRREEG